MNQQRFMRRFLPLVLFAQPAVAQAAVALTLRNIVDLVTNALSLLVGLALTISIAMIVFAGFKMAWSRGVDAEYKKGKDILWNAIVGLIVILGTGIILATISRFANNPNSILY